MKSVRLPSQGQVLERIHDGQRLLLSAPLTQDVVASLDLANAKIVEMWAWWRGAVGDLALLRQFADLQRLHVLNRTATTLDGLKYLAGLSVLTIDSDAPVDIDVAAWPRLRELAFEWTGKFVNLECAPHLSTLRVEKWREHDCALLRLAPGLQDVQITGGTLRELSGIEHCGSLRVLALVNLTKLTDFSALARCGTLQALRIDTCKKLRELNVISFLTNLEELYLNNVGDIDSLKPIAANRKLKTLHFVESTNILDGNTALIQEMGIEDYAFQNRRHYNFVYDHLRR